MRKTVSLVQKLKARDDLCHLQVTFAYNKVFKGKGHISNKKSPHKRDLPLKLIKFHKDLIIKKKKGIHSEKKKKLMLPWHILVDIEQNKLKS